VSFRPMALVPMVRLRFFADVPIPIGTHLRMTSSLPRHCALRRAAHQLGVLGESTV
jgi:hypothetical protein